MYTFVISMYLLAVKLAALFGNKKARDMVKGHKEVFKVLKEKIAPHESYLWFHAASLGEFEQGRPLMERIRKEHPSYKILLTFFSPSGYRVRCNYKGADVVCYLPFDTPFNVRRFLNLAHPKMAFFIKYEFWQNYLKGLKRRHIPVYSISSIFNDKQVFFRWYGGTYHKVLKIFTHLFVQDENSKRLLASIDVNRVSVVGDTRFDRVLQICGEAKDLPLVKEFCGDAPVFVAGSSWGPDEAVYMPYFNAHKEWKLVIASHEVDEQRIKNIEGQVEGGCVRYSTACEGHMGEARCLVIDCFGLLSSIYRYGRVAYVGGGFGKGIHNLPEAAVYGLPVFFGPNNSRFKEAGELKECGGGFEVTTPAQFEAVMDTLATDPQKLAASGTAAGNYIKGLSGAVDAIMKEIKF